jgi:hypothetical protein
VRPEDGEDEDVNIYPCGLRAHGGGEVKDMKESQYIRRAPNSFSIFKFKHLKRKNCNIIYFNRRNE